MTIFGDHDIAVVTITDTQHEGGDAITSATANEVLHSLFVQRFALESRYREGRTQAYVRD